MAKASSRRPFRYDAFISYCHALDENLARSIQRGLEELAKPWHKFRALSVFRDKTGLGVNEKLWPSIKDALLASRYMVLITSKEAAQSAWVNREVETWVGTGRPILLVLADGDLAWNMALQADREPKPPTVLPPSLLSYFKEEPLYLDLRWARGRDDLDLRNLQFQDAMAALSAEIRGMEKYRLASLAARQHRRNMRTAIAAIASLTVLLLFSMVAALVAYTKSREAFRSEDLALFRLRTLFIEQARKFQSEGKGLESIHAAARALVTRRDGSEDLSPEDSLLLRNIQGSLRELHMERRLSIGHPIAGTVQVDGDRVVSYGEEGVYQARRDGSVSLIYPGAVGSLQAFGNHLLVAIEDSAVTFIDQAGRSPLHRIQGRHPKVSVSGRSLAIHSSDTVQVWDLISMRPTSAKMPLPKDVSVELFRDGEILAILPSRLGPRGFILSEGYFLKFDFASDLGIFPKYSKALDMAVGLMAGSQRGFSIVRDPFGKGQSQRLAHGPDSSAAYDFMQDAVFSLATGRIATLSRTRARLWDFQGRPIGGILTHEGKVNGIALNEKTGALLTWSDQRMIWEWDLVTGELRKSVRLNGVPRRVEVDSVTGMSLVTTYSREVSLYDPTLRQVGAGIFEADGGRFLEGGNGLLVHNREGELSWWKFMSSTKLARIEGDDIRFNVADGDSTLAFATTRSIGALSLPSLQPVLQRAMRHPAKIISFTADSGMFAIVFENSIHLIPADSARAAHVLEDSIGLPLGPLIWQKEVSFLPTPISLGWLLWNNETIQLLDKAAWTVAYSLRHATLEKIKRVGKKITDREAIAGIEQTLAVGNQRLHRAAASQDGKTILGWSGKSIAIWQLENSAKNPIARYDGDIAHACFIGTDVRRVAVSDEEGNVLQLDAADLGVQERFSLKKEARIGEYFPGPACEEIVMVEKSEFMDGKSDARMAHVISFRSGAIRHRTIRREEIIKKAGISPDGSLIFTIAGTKAVLHTASGAATQVLEHFQELAGGAFSEDALTLLTRDVQGTLRAWDTRTGWLISTPFQFGTSLSWGKLLSRPDGDYVLAVGKDGRLATWLLSPHPRFPSGYQVVREVESATGTGYDDRGRIFHIALNSNGAGVVQPQTASAENEIGSR